MLHWSMSSLLFHGLYDIIDWKSSLYCWHFSISCWQSIIHCPRLPWLLISHGQNSFPFLNLIQHVDFKFYKMSNCGFVPSSPFKSIKMDMENLQFSMGRQYGHPSCLYRQRNVVLTNPQILFSFFSSFCESFSLLIVFFFLHENAALRLPEPACLWTACVPWACPRRSLFFFFFACLSLH